MGYESTIYIVSKTDTFYEGKRFAQVVAMFDICKYPALANMMRNKKETDCFIYADDGNTKITKDRYGKALTEATPQDVIAVLEKAVASGEEYRRIFPLLSMLKSFEEHKEQWKDVAVLHFGH